MKTGVILFNLGGPNAPDDIKPFLRNLFGDPAILALPAFFRLPLARLIAHYRFAEAKKNYDAIGGFSPLRKNTEAQAHALQRVLGEEYRVFVSMRYAAPFSYTVAQEVAAWGADRVVLLPLYPQFSTTTTASSFVDWHKAAQKAGLCCPVSRITAYSENPGLIAAMADCVKNTCRAADPNIAYRYLLTAHGLPVRIVEKGDPYPQQVAQTAKALAQNLGLKDWIVTFQSRVGPVKWLEPSTDDEIRRAGREGKGVIVVPIAFVSEHSETLVELDMHYGALARECGVRDYRRVPCVGDRESFICALADLVRACDDA